MNWNECLEYYEKLLAIFPEIERKGKSMPYTSLNGHMFSFLDKAGLVGLRLSNENRTAFIEKFNSKIMAQHGKVMKEYVVVPQKLMKNTKEFEIYFRQSYEYASSLKPKPIKKTK